MPTSFICEHTAEYLLTRRIVDLLLPQFESVIPIHFWATREGASMAMQGMARRTVRIVPVYARRPKITELGQDCVLMKINYRLFEAAAVANEYGLPMLAGLPLVTDLTGLSPNAKCAWFHITAKGGAESDCELIISIKDPSATPSHHPSIEGPIPENSLAEYIGSTASTWSWEDARHIMRGIKSEGKGYGELFGRGYQPFFAILPGDAMELQTLDEARYVGLWRTRS